MAIIYETIFGIVLELVSLCIYLFIRHSHRNTYNTDYSESTSSVPVTSVVVVPNYDNVRKNRVDDDLPPYTPPTPKTQESMIELPSSYYESEASISMNNTSSVVTNDDNVNMSTYSVGGTNITNYNTNLPPT